MLQGAGCLSGVGTYLPGTVLQGCRLFKRCQNLSARHCAAGVQLIKWCRNLSAGTVLQGCSCLSGVGTYLPGTVLQLFKQCRNLSARTGEQGCSCLSNVRTYLLALCCRGQAV